VLALVLETQMELEWAKQVLIILVVATFLVSQLQLLSE
jgi:hypothetical protein